MDETNLKAIIESLLLISDKPLTVDKLRALFDGKFDKEALNKIFKELKQDYENRSLQIQEVASGYQLATRHEYAEWIRKFHKADRAAHLSKQALDTLSIISYKQPITRMEIDNIRGVDSAGVIKTLLEKKLARIMGRREVPGRPIMYGTSRKFLEYFGLKNIADMPSLEEFKEQNLEIEGTAPNELSQTNLPFEQNNQADNNSSNPENEN